MASYTINLTEAESKALAFVALDPQEWIENAAKVRATNAIEEIANSEIQRKLQAGETISGSKEQIVLDADIKSAAEREAERQSVV